MGRIYKSLCQTCGAEFIEGGNYRVKILSAKHVPKKAQKMAESLKGKSSKDLSKFQKYMLRKSSPTNTVEVTCGTCSAVSTIQMMKPQPIKVSRKNTIQTPGPFPPMDAETKSALRKQRRLSKTPKDAHAGLYIPPEILQSKSDTPDARLSRSGKKFESGPNAQNTDSGSGKIPTKHVPGNKRQLDTPVKTSSSAPGPSKKFKTDNKVNKKVEAKVKLQEEQRGMSKLKKILFKSKRDADNLASNSATTSFKSFLSSN